MEQLTQMELLKLQELMGMEALAVRKCEMYAEHCREEELKRLFRDAADLHQVHLDGLIGELRRHNGRDSRRH